MPLASRTTVRFEKDVKLMKRRGKDTAKLRGVMKRLLHEETLDAKHRDHVLAGDYSGRRECHVEPDWLLIYKLGEDWILFERTGTHADLFG